VHTEGWDDSTQGQECTEGPNPVASTSTQPEEQELLDDEQDEEADGEVPDESFDADWSEHLMCVADPFVVTKVRSLLHYGGA
jgi:hypothetical protein